LISKVLITQPNPSDAALLDNLERPDELPAALKQAQSNTTHMSNGIQKQNKINHIKYVNKIGKVSLTQSISSVQLLDHLEQPAVSLKMSAIKRRTQSEASKKYSSTPQLKWKYRVGC
jgi:hypothetical protein